MPLREIAEEQSLSPPDPSQSPHDGRGHDVRFVFSARARRRPRQAVLRVPEKFSLDFCPAMAHRLVQRDAL
jgi:hypothetical protein